MTRCLVAATFALVSLQAHAAEPDYYDNRSDAASLVKSLYNAINRKEYARAWDYFGDHKPTVDFRAFVQGYATTGSVDLVTGATSQEGAAGSVYFQVPVAVRAHRSDGTEEVFAGCYVVRQVSASIQEPPFRPLQIDGGSLKTTAGNLDDALPAQCGEASIGPFHGGP